MREVAKNQIASPIDVLDLSNIQILIDKSLNGSASVKTIQKRDNQGVFVPTKPIPDLVGWILFKLIQEKYQTFTKFGEVIEKSKGWVFYLIYDRSKIKINQELQNKINEAFGFKILIKKLHEEKKKPNHLESYLGI